MPNPRLSLVKEGIRIGRAEGVDFLLPIGVVLTIAAAGSEMSSSMVLTIEDGMMKRSYGHDCARPKFAIMNPELTYSLPAYQTASGAADIMMHTMERYLMWHMVPGLPLCGEAGRNMCIRLIREDSRSSERKFSELMFPRTLGPLAKEDIVAILKMAK